jgi:hypothetical protein
VAPQWGRRACFFGYVFSARRLAKREGKDKPLTGIVNTKAVDERHLNTVSIKGPISLNHPVWTETAGEVDKVVVGKEDGLQYLIRDHLKVVLYEFPKGTIYPPISLKNNYQRRKPDSGMSH